MVKVEHSPMEDGGHMLVLSGSGTEVTLVYHPSEPDQVKWAMDREGSHIPGIASLTALHTMLAAFLGSISITHLTVSRLRDLVDVLRSENERLRDERDAAQRATTVIEQLRGSPEFYRRSEGAEALSSSDDDAVGKGPR